MPEIGGGAGKKCGTALVGAAPRIFQANVYGGKSALPQAFGNWHRTRPWHRTGLAEDRERAAWGEIPGGVTIGRRVPMKRLRILMLIFVMALAVPLAYLAHPPKV